MTTILEIVRELHERMTQEERTLLAKEITDLRDERATIKRYLVAKTASEDWHAVSDAANDLRVIDTKIRMLEERC